MKSIIAFLRDRSMDKIDVDGDERLMVHSEILSRKPLLRDVFTEFHHTFKKLDERFLSAQGSEIELGAGVAPIRDSYPEVLATDVVSAAHLDRQLNAEEMELPDSSVRVLYGQNCFHHFPHPDTFFCEAVRVLAPGGGVILLEPYYGPFASFLYKRLFATEGFDKSHPDWETPLHGPMNGANQALSFIVFVRDRERFERHYPQLKIVKQELCGNYLQYLLSGGLNFRQLIPSWMKPLVTIARFLLSPFDRWLALHHIVLIRKEQA